MAEWSIAAVLKTVEGHTSGGSNPSLSATKKEQPKSRVLLLLYACLYRRVLSWGQKNLKQNILSLSLLGELFYQIVMFRKSMINPAFHVHQQLIDTVTSQ